MESFKVDQDLYIRFRYRRGINALSRLRSLEAQSVGALGGHEKSIR